MDTAQLVASMLTDPAHPEVQLAQTAYRQRVASAWGIPRGARVLEVGCGQGDMTAVLADAVGPFGRVLAVDPADPGYGAPFTLSESTAHLAASELGDRLEFRLGFDVLTADFGRDEFDYVVMANCSWYFASEATLVRTLTRCRRWAPRLALSEWDLTPTRHEQVPHLLAVLLLAQQAVFEAQPRGNVRTLLSAAELRRLVDGTGWETIAVGRIESESPGYGPVQDARWEIGAALAPEAELLDVPEGLAIAMDSQRDVLRALAEQVGPRPLPTHTLLAERLD